MPGTWAMSPTTASRSWSPHRPYFAGKEYEEDLGHGHVPATYVEYLEQLRDVFAECVRVLEPGGRIAINVANLGRRPYRSLSADVTTILQDDLRLLLRGEVLWVKQRGAAGNCAWGSFQRPGNPVIRDLSERVIIASKGRFDRAISAKDRAKIGLPSISSMTRDEFMEATVDVWEIPPERASRVGHPAPFPVALPERLIHMNTYVGDLVLDPFVGSGSTAVAAVRTGRSYIGYDTEPEYVEVARRRVAEEGTLEHARSAVGLLANDGRKTEPLRGGWSSKEIAKWLLSEAAFTNFDDQAMVMPGVAPTLRGTRSQRKDVVVRSRRRSNVESPGRGSSRPVVARDLERRRDSPDRSGSRLRHLDGRPTGSAVGWSRAWPP